MAVNRPVIPRAGSLYNLFKVKNCVSHFMLPRHPAVISYEKLPLCPPAWWLVPTMHETERVGLGQWLRLSAIDKGWFLLRWKTFQHVCAHSRAYPGLKINYFRTPVRKICITVTCSLTNWAFSSSAFQHALYTNTLPLSHEKSPTHHSWHIWKHTNFFFGSYLGPKSLWSFLWCFYSSQPGQWQGAISLYSLWGTAFTGPSVATLLQELEGKKTSFFFFFFLFSFEGKGWG